jgi:cyclopropane fatty-acyl-phospholipid synthase-like methyltransferase
MKNDSTTQTTAQKVSLAAHALLAHANPLTKQQMNQLAQLLAHRLANRAGATALEIGCGAGAFSLQVAQLCAVDIHAIDVHPGFLARARETAANSQLLGSVQFSAQDAAQLPAQTYDAVICIGSSQAIGSPAQALAYCASLLKSGGTLLFADLTWADVPNAEFLEFLGTELDYYWLDSAENAVLSNAGLRSIETLRASKAAWQSYESAVLQGRLTYAQSLSQEEGQVVRQRAQAWADAYEQNGKHFLGFTAYLLEAA